MDELLVHEEILKPHFQREVMSYGIHLVEGQYKPQPPVCNANKHHTIKAREKEEALKRFNLNRRLPSWQERNQSL